MKNALVKCCVLNRMSTLGLPSQSAFSWVSPSTIWTRRERPCRVLQQCSDRRQRTHRSGFVLNFVPPDAGGRPLR